MTSIRNHIAALEDADDLIRINQCVHWVDHAPAVAAKAARENGPAILFEDIPGKARLVSGVYGGPDQMYPRKRVPWSRLARALSHADVPYEQLLSSISESITTTSPPSHGSLIAEYGDIDPHSLGLPAVGTDTTPGITFGLLVVSRDDENERGDKDGTIWAPLRGSIHGSDTLRASVPRSLGESLSDGTDATVALGVPAACLVAVTLGWAGNAVDPIPMVGALDTRSLSVDEARGGLVPASSEVLFDGTVTAVGESPAGMVESWEYTTETAGIEIQIADIALREDPVIPFTPLGAPLADDLHLTGIVETSRLLDRKSVV